MAETEYTGTCFPKHANVVDHAERRGTKAGRVIVPIGNGVRLIYFFPRGFSITVQLLDLFEDSTQDLISSAIRVYGAPRIYAPSLPEEKQRAA
jgi:hypothetical protein